MKVAFIGGGGASCVLLDYFTELDGVDVVGLADLSADAPGVVRARQLGIETTTDSQALIARRDVEVVIELTGVPKVRQIVIGALRDDQEIMTAAGARIMCEMIDQQQTQSAELADKLSEQFAKLSSQFEGAIGKINTSRGSIDKILNETKMVAMNGTIEAARAGDAGKAFGFVASRISETLGKITATLESIEAASTTSQQSLEQLHQAEADLKNVFAHKSA